MSLIVSCKSAKNSDPAPATDNSAAAANTTANTNSNCTLIQPFYWEIGNATGSIVSGTAGGTTPISSTVLQIASASKWIWASYALEKRSGVLTAQDIKALNFTAGYSSFTSCVGYATVGGCYAAVTSYNVADDGKFYYSGGNMQWQANSLLSLGSYTTTQLATEVSTYLGSDLALVYNIPQPAGGLTISAASYSLFLRKILNNLLQIKSNLGTNSVCTNPTTCVSANYTPIPTTESWHYSLGHWVEDDPTQGDGSFSSPGLYGFYPWINSGKNLYGVVARYDAANVGNTPATNTSYWRSVACGRLIRKAYQTQIAQ